MSKGIGFSPFALPLITSETSVELELQGEVGTEEQGFVSTDEPVLPVPDADLKLALEEYNLHTAEFVGGMVGTEAIASEAPVAEQLTNQQQAGYGMMLDNLYLSSFLTADGQRNIVIPCCPKTPKYHGWLLTQIAYSSQPVRLVVQACLPAPYWLAIYNAVVMCQYPVTVVVGCWGDFAALPLLEVADHVELSPVSLVVVQNVSVSPSSMSTVDATSVLEAMAMTTGFIRHSIVETAQLLTPQEFDDIVKHDRVLALYGEELRERLKSKVLE